MGRYEQRKMEYFKGSATALRLYKIWLTGFMLFSVISLTWKITTSGYEEPVYFLLDFLVCGLSMAALLSFAGFDRFTVLGNTAFLTMFLSNRVYRTLHYLGAVGKNVQTSPPDVLPMAQGMEAVMGMGPMGMNGMGMGMGAIAENTATASSLDIGLLGQLVQKLLAGPLKVTGDFSKFIVVLECELFGALCIFFIVFFLSNWKFFIIFLAQLRGQDS